MFNKFFDCMNVRHLKECVYKRKPDVRPYNSNFQRCYIKIFENVQWLQEDFLGWLDEWECSVMARDDLSLSERDRLCLSRETLDGLVVNT